MSELKPIPGHPNYSITRDGRVRSNVRGQWLQSKQHRDGHLIVRLTDRKDHLVHRLVWLTFKGPIPKDQEIDHIDRDPSNNRLDNLRLVTPSQNRLNQGISRRNTCGYKGVCRASFHARRSHASWRGRVMVNGLRYHTSYFYSAEEAAVALRELRERVCGEFAYHE